MRKITPYNYEAWYLDYLENNLSDNERKHFEEFMAENPHLFEDDFSTEDWTETQLVPGNESVNKAHLKIPENTEQLLFKKTEGTLTNAENTEINRLINENPVVAKDWKYWQLSKLSPDLTIYFPNKNKLKKKRAVVIPLWVRISVAASVAVLLYFVLKNKVSPGKQYLPKQTTFAVKSVEPKNSDWIKVKSSAQAKKEIYHPEKENIKPENKRKLPVKKEYFEKLPSKKVVIEYAVQPTLPEYRQIAVGKQQKNNMRNEFSLEEYIAFVFHKKVLNREQTEFNKESLAALTEKISAGKVRMEQTENTSVFSIKMGDFSLKRKKSF